MKKLIVIILLVASLVGSTIMLVEAASNKAENGKKVTQQTKKQVKKPTKKAVKPSAHKKIKKGIVKRAVAKLPTSGYIRCVGPDGKTAYAPKKDCDNLNNFWSKNKPSSSSNNNTSSHTGGASSNSSSNSNNNSTPAPTPEPAGIPTPTAEPIIEPTTTPTVEPIETPTPTPTVEPTATPAPTATPVPTATPTPLPASAVQKFALNVSTFEIPSGGQGLNLIVHDGNMWFAVDRTGPNSYKWPENVVYTNNVVGSLGLVTPDGVVEEWELPTGSNKPIFTDVGEFMFHITEGPDGNIWYTQPNANLIGTIDAEGNLTELVWPDGDVTPRAITGVSDGLIFMDQQYGLVGMDTQGNILGNIPNVYGVSITEGSQDTFWIGGSDVHKFDANGNLSLYDIQGRVVKIIKGVNNDIWLSQNGGHLTNITNNGVIKTYETPGFQAWNLTMDANNNVWYKDTGSNKIYSLNTTTGTISSYLLTESEKYFLTWDLAAGSDGNLWFTQNGMVGKIDITNLENIVATTPYTSGQQFDPWIDKVTVIPCTSTSCGNVKTIVVDGWRFANDAQITLKGRTVDASGNKINNYSSAINGQIVNRVNDSKISADFQNIVCDVYDVFVYSESTKKLANLNNVNLCN